MHVKEGRRVVPIECVGAARLPRGSGWKEYQTSRTVGGIQIAGGLKAVRQTAGADLHPATKEESGHDINIDFAEMSNRVGEKLAADCGADAFALFRGGAARGFPRRVIIATPNFEFGALPDGKDHSD